MRVEEDTVREWWGRLVKESGKMSTALVITDESKGVQGFPDCARPTDRAGAVAVSKRMCTLALREGEAAAPPDRVGVQT